MKLGSLSALQAPEKTSYASTPLCDIAIRSVQFRPRFELKGMTGVVSPGAHPYSDWVWRLNPVSSKNILSSLIVARAKVCLHCTNRTVLRVAGCLCARL